MHDEQIEYCKSIKNKFPLYFINRNVLDVGSLDVNGTNKYLFLNSTYKGLDIAPGKNVDIVTPAHLYDAPDESYDFIVSTECFEHDMYYEKTLQNIVRLLKSKGMFMFTCASYGREEHGTLRSHPNSSPLTANNIAEEWQNYYKNLEEKHIRESIDIDKIFWKYQFEDSRRDASLYFWGIKK